MLAVDPGKMTGLALWGPEGFSSTAWNQQDFYDGIEKAVKWADEVVSESFIVTQQTLKKSRGDNWSLEFIGVMRFLCNRHSRPFKLQGPSDAKTFATDDKLKAAGWYTKGLDHPRDAARHLMIYLLNRKLLTPHDLGLL